jgi:uncharacterized protein (TIGR00369 family)
MIEGFRFCPFTQEEESKSMNKAENLKPVPNRGNHKCFGCSKNNPSGLQMKFFTDEKSVFSWLTVPEHLSGWNNLVHGGVLSTILDEIMSWSAIYLLKKIILTKSITVDFMKPVFIGKELRVEGKVLEVMNHREALLEGFIYDKEDNLCAKSIGTFALIKPQIAKKLGFMDDEALKGLQPLIEE